MARLFSIPFQFQNNDHIALVTIREQGYDMHCQIRYVDHKLNNLLAGQRFVFSLLEGVKQPVMVSDGPVQVLLQTTVNTLTGHLNQKATVV